ncbi:unnamed protein product [Schistosoma mattheei]|uniref:Uncharacterized protein n=1 Tax=Schistosoma mattheei TaxID=31246 RepID=A0A183NQ25_9TREM|nr:unnamed protein product [Schistosoma mattheei]
MNIQNIIIIVIMVKIYHKYLKTYSFIYLTSFKCLNCFPMFESPTDISTSKLPTKCLKIT